MLPMAAYLGPSQLAHYSNEEIGFLCLPPLIYASTRWHLIKIKSFVGSSGPTEAINTGVN